MTKFKKSDITYELVSDVWEFRQPDPHSLNVLRAIYLFGISKAEIFRRAHVNPKTLDRFLNDPNRVRDATAHEIVEATKSLTFEWIIHLEMSCEAFLEEWHDCDPRTLPKNFLKSPSSSGKEQMSDEDDQAADDGDCTG